MNLSRWLSVGAATASRIVTAGSPFRGSTPTVSTANRSAPAESTRDSRLPYLPGLDGLRAIGVMAVLLYHADVSWMPGGFLGVELFFVVSGYLITSLILAERSQEHSVDLPRFWLRRAQRLLPAAFTVIVATLVYTIIFLPEEVAALRTDALAALGYVSNWYFIFDGQSYFEFAGRPSLLRHLWSLAIEEQFYLVWPLVLTLVLLKMRRPHAAILVVALAAASAALMGILYTPGEDPSRIYYGTDTRLTGLLVGSALAFVLTPGQTTLRFRRAIRFGGNAVGFVCLAGVLYFFVAIGEFNPSLYQGGFALMAVISALLIAAVIQPDSILGKIFGYQPFHWIGLRSYSIYLWHWPVFMLTRPQLDVSLDGIELLALRFAIVAVLAELSYRLIETPFRRGLIVSALKRLWRRPEGGRTIPRMAIRWAAPTAAVVAISLTIGMSAVRADSPEAPSYLSVTQIRTLSWSASAAEKPLAPIVTPRTLGLSEILRTSTPTPAPTPSPTPAPTPAPTPIPAASPPQPATQSPSPATQSPSPATASPPPSSPIPAPSSIFAGRIFAIGDSVMLGAAGQLLGTFNQIEIDAEVGRQASVAIEILSGRRDSSLLGDAVVIHIGNNGVFTADQFDRMMAILSDVPNVIFINMKVPRQWEDPNNTVLAERVSAYPNAVLIDWHTIGLENGGYFWSDDIHLRPAGAAAYTALIANYLPDPGTASARLP